MILEKHHNSRNPVTHFRFPLSRFQMFLCLGVLLSVSAFRVENRNLMRLLKVTHYNPPAFVISGSLHWFLVKSACSRTAGCSIFSLAPVLQGKVVVAFCFFRLTLSAAVLHNKFRSHTDLLTSF